MVKPCETILLMLKNLHVSWIMPQNFKPKSPRCEAEIVQNHHQPQVFVVKSSVLMVLSWIFAGKHQPFSSVKSPEVISGPLVVPMLCFAMPNRRPKKVREGRIWAVESLFFRWKNIWHFSIFINSSEPLVTSCSHGPWYINPINPIINPPYPSHNSSEPTMDHGKFAMVATSSEVPMVA